MDGDRQTRLLNLPDGRRLAVSVFGDATGRPVFYQHGFPGSRLEAALVAEEAARLGVRLIAIDRPGYGRSDVAPGRRFADWAADLSAAASELGIGRFALLGVSGGALFTLAVAAHLKERVSALGLVCGLAPVVVPELALALHLPARLCFGLMRFCPRLARPFFRSVVSPLLAARPAWTLGLLAPVMPAADRAILRRPDVRERLVASIAEAFRRGGDGVVQDLELLAGPLDFSLLSIRVPVMIWHGGDDRTVPVAHGRWYAAQLPTAVLEEIPGEGHFSLPVRRGGHILEALRAMMEQADARA
ncbi:pimeloyl-ACP methyl ester carboxylesterase [Geothermobacter ehrlichii]|uniref:Pimeloyl-ACP methyl ester carboxylesterase n=1 Tax=Geothermobacter ehrlichii TaxID=213224 RepID=A0A5D3WL20_9BACT|nr:alpha/beta fold hydrolase [Geothermobacter ehrlichii]TYO98213.1 pimeloyl-ACP methyl ester carboxylesterase [Geothermobacter ehrlichii]